MVLVLIMIVWRKETSTSRSEEHAYYMFPIWSDILTMDYFSIEIINPTCQSKYFEMKV